MSLPKLNPDDLRTICAKRDYCLLVDESISMNTPDCPGATTRWNYAKEVMGYIVMKCDEYDPDDGLDLVFFGGKPRFFENVTAANLSEVFPDRPMAASTQLGVALDQVFKRYFSGPKTQPITYVVLTDGEATDPTVVETALRNAAQASGSGEQIAVAFWQVGYDAGASRFLQKLDDALGEIDIVDTQTMDTVVENFGNLELLLANAVIG
jgi:uncharacterized protein with von Willebrand factor type A (vWA) domain